MKHQLTLILFFTLALTIGLHGQEQVKIAFVGNSITAANMYSWEAGTPWAKSFPEVVDHTIYQYFGDIADVRNFGNGGKTLTDKLDENQVIYDGSYMRTSTFTDALNFAPDICFISLGTNDGTLTSWYETGRGYLTEFYDDYLSMIDSFLLVNPETQFVLCFPPPIYEQVWVYIDSVIVKGVIPEMRRVLETTGYDSLDFHSLLIDRTDLFPDHIHPNITGSELMGKYVFEKILSTDLIGDYIGESGNAFNKPASCSDMVNDNGPGFAVNDNPEDYWEVTLSDSASLCVDMKNSYALNIARIAWGDDATRTYEIQVSDDSIHWSTVILVENDTSRVSILQGLEGNGRYLRLCITGNSSESVKVSNLGVYGTIDFPGENLTDLPGFITCQYSGSPELEKVEKLIDNEDTKFFTYHKNSWVQFQGLANYVITGYSVSAAGDSPDRDPVSWILQASSDEINWVDLDSVGYNGAFDFKVRYHREYREISDTNAYTYFRLNLNSNISSMQFSEWELFGVYHSTPPSWNVKLNTNPADIGVTLTGDSIYWEARPVTIYASNIEGYQFEEWTGSTGDLALLDDVAAATSHFTMPTRDVEYTANYKILANNAVELTGNISVYPNPATNFIVISSEFHIYEYELYTIYGRKVLKDNWSGEQLNIESLERGIYILKVNTDEGYSQFRIVKN